MSHVRQIAVERPLEASAHEAIRQLGQTLSARPLSAWLVRLARKVGRSPLLAGGYVKLLGVFSAPDQLTFQADPAQPPLDHATTLTVMTANLWHDWPRFRRQRSRLEAFAQLVEQAGADVLLLQEVARTGDFRVDQWLADRLGMAYAYGQANGDERHNAFEEGVAVLSRYPLADPALCYLAPRPFSLVRRLAVGVTIKAPGGDFLAVSAHLGHGRRLNTRQLERLQAWASTRAAGRPAVVGGDFNTGENSPQMRWVRDRWLDVYRRINPDADGTTYQLHWPWGKPMLRQRLDYIFLQQGRSPWQVTEARAAETTAPAHSDHLAVLARLETDVRIAPQILDNLPRTSVPIAA